VKEELIKKYATYYPEEEFYKANIFCVLSEEKLQEDMKKLGAKNTEELIRIFNIFHMCLKTNAKIIRSWLRKREKEKESWLRSLTEEEQEAIIEHELYNHECDYTWDIGEVADLFENVFTYDQIMKVLHKIAGQWE